MTRFLHKRMWLAGASLLAILVGSGNAGAVVFGGPQGVDYIIPTTGYYDFKVAGADGGGPGGGVGAVVGGELLLDAGETLDIVVGEAGESSFNGGVGNGYAGGGGGGSFVFEGALLLFAAGGGGGANFFGPLGSPGIGSGGSPSGPASYGGAGGGGYGDGFDFPGGGSEFSGGQDAQSGSFPYGGSGAKGYWGTGPSGGYGGGGGAGYNFGGGGGGAPGGGEGGGGGFSYVIDTARDPFGITGGNPVVYNGSGYVSINFVGPPVPEPSTWAMAIAGFAGLGWLARLRAQKPKPA
jgi:hypothetical protein